MAREHQQELQDLLEVQLVLPTSLAEQTGANNVMMLCNIDVPIFRYQMSNHFVMDVLNWYV